MIEKPKRDLYEDAKPFAEYAKAILGKTVSKRLIDGDIDFKAVAVPPSDRRRVKESVVQAEILQWLRSRGWFAHKAKAVNLVGSGENLRLAATDRGIPDILACSPGGMFFAIEVKAPSRNARTDLNQLRQMQAIRKAGGHAFFAHSLRVVEEYLAYQEKRPGSESWPLPPSARAWATFREHGDWPDNLDMGLLMVSRDRDKMRRYRERKRAKAAALAQDGVFP